MAFWPGANPSASTWMRVCVRFLETSTSIKVPTVAPVICPVCLCTKITTTMCIAYGEHM